jgi:hypothetical protein
MLQLRFKLVLALLLRSARSKSCLQTFRGWTLDYASLHSEAISKRGYEKTWWKGRMKGRGYARHDGWRHICRHINCSKLSARTKKNSWLRSNLVRHWPLRTYLNSSWRLTVLCLYSWTKTCYRTEGMMMSWQWHFLCMENENEVPLAQWNLLPANQWQYWREEDEMGLCRECLYIRFLPSRVYVRQK